MLFWGDFAFAFAFVTPFLGVVLAFVVVGVGVGVAAALLSCCWCNSSSSLTAALDASAAAAAVATFRFRPAAGVDTAESFSLGSGESLEGLCFMTFFMGRSQCSIPGGQYTRPSGPPMPTSSSGIVVVWMRSCWLLGVAGSFSAAAAASSLASSSAGLLAFLVFFPLLFFFGVRMGLLSSFRTCGMMSLTRSKPGSLNVRMSSKTACSLSLASIMRSIVGGHGGNVATRGLCFLRWRPVIADGVGSE